MDHIGGRLLAGEYGDALCGNFETPDCGCDFKLIWRRRVRVEARALCKLGIHIGSDQPFCSSILELGSQRLVFADCADGR